MELQVGYVRQGGTKIQMLSQLQPFGLVKQPWEDMEPGGSNRSSLTSALQDLPQTEKRSSVVRASSSAKLTGAAGRAVSGSAGGAAEDQTSTAASSNRGGRGRSDTGTGGEFDREDSSTVLESESDSGLRGPGRSPSVTLPDRDISGRSGAGMVECTTPEFADGEAGPSASPENCGRSSRSSNPEITGEDGAQSTSSAHSTSSANCAPPDLDVAMTDELPVMIDIGRCLKVFEKYGCVDFSGLLKGTPQNAKESIRREFLKDYVHRFGNFADEAHWDSGETYAESFVKGSQEDARMKLKQLVMDLHR